MLKHVLVYFTKIKYGRKKSKKIKMFLFKDNMAKKMNPGALCRQDHAHVFYLKNKVLCQNNPPKKLFQNKCTP